MRAEKSARFALLGGGRGLSRGLYFGGTFCFFGAEIPEVVERTRGDTSGGYNAQQRIAERVAFAENVGAHARTARQARNFRQM